MKLKKENGIMCQNYEAPRAESVEMSNEGLLCASFVPVEYGSTIKSFGDGGNI